MIGMLLVMKLFLVLLVCHWSLSLPSRPIIGVLLQEDPGCGDKPYTVPTDYKEYIEQAGGGAVPIFPLQNETYYRFLLDRVNGVLFPGGTQDIVASSYAKAAQLIFQIAMEKTASGIYLPLWGTCLGMQEMTTFPLTPFQNLLTNCTGTMNTALPLSFTHEASKSKLFGSLPLYIVKSLATDNVTANFHLYCLSKATYAANAQLKDFFRVTSTNLDSTGLEFVSTMEARRFPFYGVQWHPEKNNLFFVKGTNINHSRHAVLISQYFADFLIMEANRNQQTFDSFEQEGHFLFQNYKSLYNPNTQMDVYCLGDSDVPPQ